ncbi:MAG: acyl-CoA dehydrogenase family protein [Acidobacteriota bacterium]
MPEAAGATVSRKKTLPSFAKGLFEGEIDETLIFPYPHLPAEEQDSLDLVLESFNRFAVKHLDGARFDREMEIPQEIIAKLGELGVLGLTVPEEYGGFGFSTGSYARLMEDVCRYCAATATVVGGHQSIGIKGIIRFGSEEQKREYLPKMATGEWIGAYALTEPGSGSDAAAMTTRAVLDEEGSHYILNGRKQWITNGGFARVFTVFARIEIPGESRPTRTISCFLVKSDQEGVSTTPPMHKMGIRGSNTVDVVFDNVRVPVCQLLGRPGGGFKMAMEILNTGRLSLAAGCIGACKDMIARSSAHATQRRAFGTTISQFEMIRSKFARMMCETYAAESMVYMTTGLCDAGQVDFSLESAICKIFASEVLWRVANDAVQINGGNGYMSEYPYERVLRDSRINLIFEGTNEILRHYVALAGMAGPGARLKAVGKAMKDPIDNIGLLTGEAARRLKKAVVQPKLGKVHDALKEERDLVIAWTQQLAAAVQKALVAHGKAITAREHLQERFADAAIDLYGMLATLSRTTDRLEKAGPDGASRELKMTRLFCKQAWRRVRRNLAQITRHDDDLINEVAEMAYRDAGYKVN